MARLRSDGDKREQPSRPGSAKQVEPYVRTVRSAPRAEAYLRPDTLPGERAQVDRGNFGQVRIGSTARLVSCFVLVPSARGNENGRVERFVGFLRNAFFAARPFTSVADLNAQLAAWIADVAHAHPVPGRREQRVAHALAEEQPRLLALPARVRVRSPGPCAPARRPTSGSTATIARSGAAGRSPVRDLRVIPHAPSAYTLLTPPPTHTEAAADDVPTN